MQSTLELLSLLKALVPEENEDYTVEDVQDSLDLCLKSYIDENNGKYQLKSYSKF